jgi:hypothetical protein
MRTNLRTVPITLVTPGDEMHDRTVAWHDRVRRVSRAQWRGVPTVVVDFVGGAVREFAETFEATITDTQPRSVFPTKR